MKLGVTMEKFCKSCGMPMDRPEDFANNDTNSDYCYYCGDKEEYYNKEESYENKDYLDKVEYHKKKELKPKRKVIKKTRIIKKKPSKPKKKVVKKKKKR